MSNRDLKHKRKRRKHVPLWAVLPSLTGKETATRILARGKTSAGPLTEKERAYLEKVVRDGDDTEQFLRECGYYDPGPKGRAFRLTGDIFESEEEARKVLNSLNNKQ